MNTIERAWMHALFVHWHHNSDKAIDFKAIKALNQQVNQLFPGALLGGLRDEADVVKFSDTDCLFGAKMESHGSPCLLKIVETPELERLKRKV